MKLLQQTGRSYLRHAALALAVAGIILFVVLTSIIGEEVTEKLQVNVDRIEARLASGEAVPSLPPVLEVEQLVDQQAESLALKDTLLHDPQENDEELFREVIAIRTIAGRSYRITLRQVVLEPHDYLSTIGLALAVAFALLLLVLFVIQRRIAKRTWGPFYNNLSAMKRFSLKDQQPLVLFSTNVDEFNDLNNVVNALVAKVIDDHRSLKEFSENAAHEMRTPLSVIQTRLEDAAQDPGLSQAQAMAIGAAQTAVQRLSNLNGALLLLTRIDNLQFTARSIIIAATVIDEVLENLQGHITERNIRTALEMDRSAAAQGEPDLFRILVSNLLKNAVGHNMAGGSLTVQLTADRLLIRNTGKPLNSEPQRMFERFTRNSEERGGIGLGLSIAQRICAVHGWTITYSTLGNEHIMDVGFALQEHSKIAP
jgi:two-component system, OmpR family, sensor kinase